LQSISQTTFIDISAALPIIVGARTVGQLFSERDDFCVSHRSLLNSQTQSIRAGNNDRYSGPPPL
jgi:hypothetical protein